MISVVHSGSPSSLIAFWRYFSTIAFSESGVVSEKLSCFFVSLREESFFHLSITSPPLFFASSNTFFRDFVGSK
nr:MAG TPA: hypothetical protein [Caudoviricetes sp.]